MAGGVGSWQNAVGSQSAIQVPKVPPIAHRPALNHCAPTGLSESDDFYKMFRRLLGIIEYSKGWGCDPDKIRP